MISTMHLKNGIFIDSKNETITECIIDTTKGLEDYYTQLECRTFDIAHIGNGHDVYIDDEGLLNIQHDTKFFTIKGYPQPLVGNGVVMGFEAETGETINCTLTIDEVKARVKFYTLDGVRNMPREFLEFI
jgi:hypothetical protein